ncbi:hypothetical protein [Streptomyces sp. S.PB5]|uniref:hypothetical protein n=1 Tax=Streptomyces sp. S.PB5 TaxID=3020844 RepID=UPI0025B1CB50|nr:hypothetical protein [Streptomyces sp. S.PB5]MDN3028302.1 hypothetical protein [Streptomyces sp. S.PB5]
MVSLGIEDPDGTFTVLAELDGRCLSSEVADGFASRVIGMYAAAGTVRFGWLDYEPLDRWTGPLPRRPGRRPLVHHRHRRRQHREGSSTRRGDSLSPR